MLFLLTWSFFNIQICLRHFCLFRSWQPRLLERDLLSPAGSRRAEKSNLLVSEPHRANHQTLIVFLRFHGFISIFNYLCNFTMISDEMAMAGITRSVLRPCRHFVGSIFPLKNYYNMIDCSLWFVSFESKIEILFVWKINESMTKKLYPF